MKILESGQIEVCIFCYDISVSCLRTIGFHVHMINFQLHVKYIGIFQKLNILPINLNCSFVLQCEVYDHCEIKVWVFYP